VNLLPLDPDELLSTTRAVRKRLDFDRPVPAELIRECVSMALQAPCGSNVVRVRFVVVTDPEKRQKIGQFYGEAFAEYRASPNYAGKQVMPDPASQAQQNRVASSSEYLAERMGDAPALVIAVNTGPDREAATAGIGNVAPAAWSFMLAARARGLGTAWTTLHRSREREVDELLGIPYDTVVHAVLTPVAYTKGTDFHPALRPAADEFIHWDSW
jgi:nitroreductase